MPVLVGFQVPEGRFVAVGPFAFAVRVLPVYGILLPYPGARVTDVLTRPVGPE